jgi:hypothetical protein
MLCAWKILFDKKWIIYILFFQKKILELLALLETKLFLKKTHDEKKKSTKFLRKIPKEDKIWKEKKRNDPKQTNNN